MRHQVVFSLIVALSVVAGLAVQPERAFTSSDNPNASSLFTLWSSPAASTLNRLADPVVLTGADVPWLTGIDPNDLVAFRYDGGWQQIPVQVDERAFKDFGDIYGSGGPYGATELIYTDSGTFTGPDPDATLDDDDEIVFMAKDAAGAAPSSSEPTGIVPGSAAEVTITDPLDAAASGSVYLFHSDDTLDPGAGRQYVSYTFDLLSGDYLETYNAWDGPNPEDSVATTPYYSHHFSDRWISDEIRVTTGAASGVDILDRHKNLFAPGNCGRSENTFSDGEGAFIVNKSGPVRALRSYIGANSGPLTQRENIFYERRQDIRTFLRVHAIGGMMDFFDYSPAASGMTYYNDLNTSGVTIDGNPDSVTLGGIQWEMVTGPQGSLVMTGSVLTNIAGFAPTSYYLDDSTPSVTQCTGDAFAYGSSGTFITQSIPCTDPSLDCTYYLHSTRTIYYDAPGLTATDAEEISSQASAPLTYAVSPSADQDADGVPDSIDNCPFDLNPDQANTPLGPIDNGPDINGDDTTNPYEDAVGDACDDDTDNDGLPDAQESDSACPFRLIRDSDGDGSLDGYEVAQGLNPCDPASKPAQGPSDDSDSDGFSDDVEARGWGTDPYAADSDGDACEDWIEIASVNADKQANILDVQWVAKMAFGIKPPHLALDLDKNGALNILDVQMEARNSTLLRPHAPCP